MNSWKLTNTRPKGRRSKREGNKPVQIRTAVVYGFENKTKTTHINYRNVGELIMNNKIATKYIFSYKSSAIKMATIKHENYFRRNHESKM